MNDDEMNDGIITLTLSIVAWASAKSEIYCELACGFHYDPVCATNGRTYDNRCFLYRPSSPVNLVRNLVHVQTSSH
ncbi:unnamed protein product [Leptidea sinapis]|uniref:Kazal-like domain-containing protein n=1 Tax=Leptidea sinapis TaxID=189913 RepID=A0A5E4QPN5_9NEOP|nr:unnamed protein product [Leptidea sinapis]